MAHPHRPFLPSALALAAALTCLACTAASAQTAPDTTGPSAQAVTLPAVVVNVRAPVSPTGLTGFTDKPLVSLPLQATVLSRELLDESQARRLADVLTYEASATDAYNSPGYWDFVAVRGFVLDQRHNYRREGLPITGETVIPLQNKERIEILKGTSGIQAGNSSPGGLVNYVVKRPTAAPLRSGTLTAGERGSIGAAVDFSDRAGEQGAFGYRVNLSTEDRQPQIDHYGHVKTRLAAVAADWRLSPDTLMQVELEASRQEGRSLPGHSLVGGQLPAVRRPDNLNNQPWSQPNVFDGLTGSLRLEQKLAGGWIWVSQAATQRLKTDDRLAYPYGPDCSLAGDTLCGYAANGDYDVYDFRSENERRRVHALETAFSGELVTGPVRHAVRTGVQVSRRTVDVETGSNNWVGVGNLDGTKETPSNDERLSPGTDSFERSLEWFATDAMDWGQGVSTWLGVRHTRLRRETLDTAGDNPSGASRSVTTPWLAASYEWAHRQHVYASWGEGAESYVVPGTIGQSDYTNGGQSLLAKTRQWELGTKGESGNTGWGVAYFDIKRPEVDTTGAAYVFDGKRHHQGIDGQVTHTTGPWQLRAGAMLMKARREGASNAALNGTKPVNVPERTLKAHLRYRVPAVPGLDLQANVTHEGRRNVLEDGSIELPSWTRTDLTTRYTHKLDTTTMTWTLGVINAFDRRAWKESPQQYGHVYLFALEARTVQLNLSIEL